MRVIFRIKYKHVHMYKLGFRIIWIYIKLRESLGTERDLETNIILHSR